MINPKLLLVRVLDYTKSEAILLLRSSKQYLAYQIEVERQTMSIKAN